MLRRLAWLSLALVMLLVVAVIGGGIYLRRQLHASLPIQEGTVSLPGLEADVTVARDALGVPTITALSRRDAAAALGFLHAQERFFQMDLQRRQAAGELSALVGGRALELDRSARVHRFRHISQKALAHTAPSYRGLLEAYANGVNAGLAALRSAPIEYHVLNAAPEPWKPEDTLLTGFAMFNTLQGRQGLFEATFGTLAETVPAPMYEFLTARGSEWDTPLNGATFPRPPVPSREVVRSAKGRQTRPQRLRDSEKPIQERAYGSLCLCASVACLCRCTKRPPVWAATTGRSRESTRATGVALVANDMHLAIGVPNIWYRASIKIAGVAGSMREAQTITGVTLARRSQHHRRQQRPRGVGIHQYRRRLERSGRDRT